MSGAFDVDTTAMRSHSAKVAALVSRADMAKDAAAEVSFHAEAFGKIGAALVYPFLMPLEAAGRTATALTSETLNGTAEAVRGMADAYDAVDRSVESLMRRIEGVTR